MSDKNKLSNAEIRANREARRKARQSLSEPESKPSVPKSTKVSDEVKESYDEMGRTRQVGHKNVKPVTRSERKMSKRAISEEKEKRINREQNKIRVQTGKEQKVDRILKHKPSIWEKMGEKRLYSQLREIGDTYKSIDKFQRNRVLMTILLLVLGVLGGIYINEWFYAIGGVLALVFYFTRIRKVDSFYKMWKFHRHMNFSKFTRLVIPYLKASGGNAALYTIFNKILDRTEDETDRRSIYQLMGEMGDDPASIQPFVDYADRSSGSDMSHLFMTTIFDFQQSTFDVSTIDELGQLAAEDMMKAIDEIIMVKLNRFNMFPTKIVLSTMLVIGGFGVGIGLDSFKQIGFDDIGDIGNIEDNEGFEDTDTDDLDEDDAVSDDSEDIDVEENDTE